MLKKVLSILLILAIALPIIPASIPVSATTDYRSWKQYSGQWANYKLGASSCTVKKYGCTTTALAMAAIMLGCENENDFDPGIFVARMNNSGGYTSGGALYWSKVNKAVPNMSMVGNEVKFSNESEDERIDIVKKNLEKGYAVIISILRYTDNKGKHWHYVLADTVKNGELYILDPGGNNGNIKNKYGNAEIMIRSIRCFENNGHSQYTGEVKEPVTTHTHSFVTTVENNHPHERYGVCSCGTKSYVGKSSVTNCVECYPLGNTKLTRSFEKTKGTATFYREDVNNATKYTLKLYKNDSWYNDYNMSTAEYIVTGLSNGEYEAILYIYNENTDESKSTRCESFRIVDTYTVSYNANGGTNAPSNQTKIQGTPLTLSNVIPQRQGYKFLGWATGKSSSKVAYSNGDRFDTNANVVLYAVWEPEVYTISFDANGGEGVCESVSLTFGDKTIMPNDVIREGYYLKGWSLVNNSSVIDYKLNSEYKFEQSAKLYAVWGRSNWSGNVAKAYAGGSGTEDDPYLISNSGELALLAKDVNAQTTEPEYKYYKLISNIDLGYSEWVPIGIGDGTYQYFKGCFDGAGYTISGLYISGDNYTKIGLFGYTKNSLLENVTITGDIEAIGAESYVSIGALVGSVFYTSIKNVNIKNFNISNVEHLSNKANIGLVCGYSSYLGTISNCTVTSSYIWDCDVYEAYIGGICGNTEGYIMDCSIFAEETLFKSIYGDISVNVGGIAGYVKWNVDRCFVEAPRLIDKQNIACVMELAGITAYASAVKSCAVKFTNKETIAYNSKEVPYSIYIIQTSSNRLHASGIAQCDVVENCKYDGASIIVENTSTKISTLHTLSAGGVSANSSNPGYITNCIVDVEGIISSKAYKKFSYAGGILGRSLHYSYSNPLKISSSLVLVDSVEAVCTSGTKEEYVDGEFYGYSYGGVAGDVGCWANQEITKCYTIDKIILNATTRVDERTTLKSEDKIKSVAFQSGLLGLNAYVSLANIKENAEAVWILKDGEIPDLYYTHLKEVSVLQTENGILAVDKERAIAGETVTITATPNEGYLLEKVTVNGEEIVGTTFVLQDNCVIHAVFIPQTEIYNVKVEAHDNAKGSLVNLDNTDAMMLFGETDKLTVNDGEEIQVNTTANTDYTVDTIYVNGEEIAGNNFIVTDNSVVTMEVVSIDTEIEAITYDAKNVGSDEATLSGCVSGEGEGITRYIRYWEKLNPDEIYITEIVNNSGEYTVDVTMLNPETTYEYQMTKDGEIRTFTTEEAVVAVLDDEEIIVDVTGVSLDKSSVSLTARESVTLAATVAPEDASNADVTWKSSNKNVATVENGVVTAVGAGNATITVTTEDGGFSAKCVVTVKATTVPATGIGLDKTSVELSIGGFEQLNATVAPSNATDKSVTWSSTNEGVAMVSSAGMVVGVGVGTAVIVAKANNGNHTAFCVVTVSEPTVEAPAEPEITLSGTDPLTVTLTGEFTGKVVVALYNDQNTMIEVTAFDAVESKTINFTDSGSYVKVMWVESLISLTPKCEAKFKSLN
ncbi:MAG: Ig-like domain-containing protein [Clostridia bacterium]|nr:Ig-like domain-containing protein [Clostridia bacterium]